ncbi:MAG: sugar transferase [Acidobacteriota bacterium]
MKILARYSPEQARGREVKPGMTGGAQVNGPDAMPWEEKFELDVWYVDQMKFRLHLKILWMTFVKVLDRETDQRADGRNIARVHGD